MAKSRPIGLHAFLASLQPNTLLRFLEGQGLTEAVAEWLHMNPERLLAYCDEPANVERCDPVLEVADRISEICRDGAGLAVRAYRRLNLSFDPEAHPAELAMLLFLDHRDAYEFARAKFLLYGGGTTLSVFRLRPERVAFSLPSLEAFRAGLGNWFASQDKGTHCLVTPFVDGDETVLLIQRGAYLETRPVWENDDIKLSTTRPAIEDLVTWDEECSELRIRTSYERDRQRLLELFAEHFCGDRHVAEHAHDAAMFSLDPLRDGTFSFEGKGMIRAIELREVRIGLHGVSRGMVTLKADDVRQMLEYDTPGITLRSGSLVEAKFRFLLHAPGKKSPRPFTFTITPPFQTSVGERRNALAILAYLEEQGVKLR